MTGLCPLTHDAPGLYGPPDDPPSIMDDQADVEELFSDAGIPDYLCSIFADLCCNGFGEHAKQRAMRDLYRHLMPMIEDADKKAAKARRYGDEP